MKFISTFIPAILFNYLTAFGQTNSKNNFIDPLIAKQITMSGFCLCQTTLPNLKNLTSDLKEIEVVEMNITKNCKTKEAPFEYGKGYYTDKYPGMIFQKDTLTDHISKIRLTRNYKGSLPDGTFIDLGKLLLKDLFKLYPIFKHQWKGRDCSEYWHFSNDTIFFYLKIDSAKPRFPLDELSYYNKPIEAIDIVISCSNLFDKDKNRHDPIFTDPLFFIDSIRVSNTELKKYKPYEIASVKVLKGPDAIKLVGQHGKNGVVYIETKNYVKNKYWNYLKSKSKDYLKAVPNAQSDSLVAYIVNDKVLKTNFEADLSVIDNKIFIDLIIISKEKLVKDYAVFDKSFGVLIRTNKTEENPK